MKFHWFWWVPTNWSCTCPPFFTHCGCSSRYWSCQGSYKVLSSLLLYLFSQNLQEHNWNSFHPSSPVILIRNINRYMKTENEKHSMPHFLRKTKAKMHDNYNWNNYTQNSWTVNLESYWIPVKHRTQRLLFQKLELHRICPSQYLISEDLNFCWKVLTF